MIGFLSFNLGHRLKNCIIFETDETWSLLDCSHMCMKQQPQCRSINFAKTQSRCQLNNQTKGAKASDLILDTDFNYYEQISVRLSQGMIKHYGYTQPVTSGAGSLKIKWVIYSCSALLRHFELFIKRAGVLYQHIKARREAECFRC